MKVRICVVAAILGMIALTGCSGGPKAKVTGRVTCLGKPVAGTILFSPKGDSADNTGQAVNAVLDADGRYSLELKSIGGHHVMIRPNDMPAPGAVLKAYPCKLSLEREVAAGISEITIELSKSEP